MPGERSLPEALRNLLQYGDLSFRDFVELALYHPQFGYYATDSARVGKEGDFVTSPTLSPVFGFAISRLVNEFLARNAGVTSTIVDIGCGDGGLVGLVADGGWGLSSASADSDALGTLSPHQLPATSLYGVDRSLERTKPHPAVQYHATLDAVPRGDAQLVISNELFDAFPFARLVQRGEHLHELWVRQEGDSLDWSEHEASLAYDDYFAARGIALEDGQFADVSLEWALTYADIARWTTRGLIVTFDYGYPEDQLFRSRARRFGTAAAYGRQRVTRDLLANPGQQDLTAHINFTDLRRAGEEAGFTTLFFDRQAKFLLALGITGHELFKPVLDEQVGSAEEGLARLEARDEARRLVLPDGIGHDIRVLVQAKGMGEKEWSFQRALW
jgi:SAM-dependent MidA family methyltransferase